MLRLIDLKDDVYNVDYAIKTVEIAIENAKKVGKLWIFVNCVNL